MGGKRSGISRKRRTLTKTFRIGSLSKADRRSAAVRHVLEGAAQILEDAGGAETASLLRTRMAYRVMHLDAILAQDELRLAQGGQIDRVNYLSAAQTWLRYALALGLQRRPKPVESLHEYMAREGAVTEEQPGGSSVE